MAVSRILLKKKFSTFCVQNIPPASHGWYIPRVTQLTRITVMVILSNQLKQSSLSKLDLDRRLTIWHYAKTWTIILMFSLSLSCSVFWCLKDWGCCAYVCLQTEASCVLMLTGWGGSWCRVSWRDAPGGSIWRRPGWTAAPWCQCPGLTIVKSYDWVGKVMKVYHWLASSWPQTTALLIK